MEMKPELSRSLSRSVEKTHFTASVRVAVSRQFLSWVMALGEGAKIVGPEPVVEQVREETKRLMQQYDIKTDSYKNKTT